MSDQLRLLPTGSPWRLSTATRQRGRRGVAAARAVLQESRARARAAELADDPCTPGPDPDTDLAPAA